MKKDHRKNWGANVLLPVLFFGKRWGVCGGVRGFNRSAASVAVC